MSLQPKLVPPAAGVVALLRDAPAAPQYWATSTYTVPAAEQESFWGNLALPVTRHVNEVCSRIDSSTTVVNPVSLRAIRALVHCDECWDAELLAPAERAHAHFLAESAMKLATLESTLEQARSRWTPTLEGAHLLAEQLGSVVHKVSPHPALSSWHEDGSTYLRMDADSTGDWALACGMGADDAALLGAWFTGRATAIEESLAGLVADWHATLAQYARDIRDADPVVAPVALSMNQVRVSNFAFLATATAPVLAVGDRFLLVRVPRYVARRAGLDFDAAVDDLATVPPVCAGIVPAAEGAFASPLSAVLCRLLDDGYDIEQAMTIALAAVT